MPSRQTVRRLKGSNSTWSVSRRGTDNVGGIGREPLANAGTNVRPERASREPGSGVMATPSP